jgi:hypothetical protein
MSPEHLLATSGARRNELLVKLTHFEGIPLLDVRFWYTDREGKLQPTRKGISLPPGHFGVVAETLERYSAAIQAWLSGESDVEDLLRQGAEESGAIAKARAHYAALLSTADRARLQSGAIEVEEVDEPRSRFCFAVDHLGGKEQVLLNRAHPFGRRMADATSPEELRTLLLGLIASFSRARCSMSDDEDVAIFELLERDWAERLAAFARTELPQPIDG